MALLAAVVALALAASLALGPRSCEGFVSGGLRLGPRLRLIGLQPGVMVFQPVGLLADMVDECLRDNSGDMVDEMGRGQDAQCEACKLLWDPPEYNALVIFIIDANPATASSLRL